MWSHGPLRKCGNNCCNGSYGKLPDESQCDACPDAYAMQEKGEMPEDLRLRNEAHWEQYKREREQEREQERAKDQNPASLKP